MFDGNKLEVMELCGDTRPVSVMDRLTRNKERLEAQLKDVNAAIDSLNKNPETLALLDLLRKVGL
jgi:hypothetical protein